MRYITILSVRLEIFYPQILTVFQGKRLFQHPRLFTTTTQLSMEPYRNQRRADCARRIRQLPWTRRLPGQLKYRAATGIASGARATYRRCSIEIPLRIQDLVSLGICAVRCAGEVVKHFFRAVRSHLKYHAAAFLFAAAAPT